MKDKISSLENQIKTGKTPAKKSVNTTSQAQNNRSQDKITAPATVDASFANAYSSVVKENSIKAHALRPQMSFEGPEIIVNKPVNVEYGINVKKNVSNVNESASSSSIKELDDKGEWITVEKKKGNRQSRTNKKVCYGTNMDSTDNAIKGAIRRRWMYVGKIAGKNISEQDVHSFLKNIEGNELITVKKLNTLGQNSAFSIGLPSDEAYKRVFCETFWPRGVILREFSFDRNFFQKNRVTQKT